MKDCVLIDNEEPKIAKRIQLKLPWVPEKIEDLDNIPIGDMPGDKVIIGADHIFKATLIFPRLLEMIMPVLNGHPYQRVVIAVCGGSGVGKSELASLLSYYFSRMGVGSYILSGDNYPYRIPKDNDAERRRVFRWNGIKGLISQGDYTCERQLVLKQLQKNGDDADPEQVKNYPWLSIYQNKGYYGLKTYLGTTNEIDFEELNDIIAQFKNGKPEIFLKRMGRNEAELWYDSIDFTSKNLMIIEWTHGNSDNLQGVDIPILLNSTPQETLKHRKARNRDDGTDSHFTTMVLNIEQEILISQASKAKLIVSKNGVIISYNDFIDIMTPKIKSGTILNVYPDSIGSALSDIVKLLKLPELKGAFQLLYILPSIFNTDLDRGFSVIDYELNEVYASQEDMEAIKNIDVSLILDFVLNHSSVLSSQFQDVIKNGEKSKYNDFFINWNDFWKGYGQMTEEGYIQPDPEYIKDMFFRKQGLPILNVYTSEGRVVPYWNTFYQEVKYEKVDVQDILNVIEMQYTSAERLADIINNALCEGRRPDEIQFCQYSRYSENIIKFLESRRKYLGQMDLNINSPLVWEFYEDTLKKLAQYGAKIVRLDAFAYASKKPGAKNFFNEPESWDFLRRIKQVADKYGLVLLPEIHSKYEEKLHEKFAGEGYMIYDFFLPGLIIDALERNRNEFLLKWIKDLREKNMWPINMLGCHDGIPLLDLKGLIPDEQIDTLIKTVVDRGGYIKNLSDNKPCSKEIYYQVNATYYSALGEDDRKLLLARAIQIFMPGRPQIWYLDLFAGKNDYAAVKKAGRDGHKEINRTNLNWKQVEEALNKEVVTQQISLLKFRNSFPAFEFGANLEVLDSDLKTLRLRWEYNGYAAILEADLKNYNFKINATDEAGQVIYNFTSVTKLV